MSGAILMTCPHGFIFLLADGCQARRQTPAWSTDGQLVAARPARLLIISKDKNRVYVWSRRTAV